MNAAHTYYWQPFLRFTELFRTEFEHFLFDKKLISKAISIISHLLNGLRAQLNGI